MTENTLKDYLNGKVSADVLNADLVGTDSINDNTHSYKITDIKNDGEFVITIKHLVKLFNDILNQKLKLTDLNTIFFALEASDYFIWDTSTKDGNRVQEAISNISENGKPITMDYIQYCSYYLETGEHR